MVFTLSYLPSGNGGPSTLLKSRSSVGYISAFLASSEGGAVIQAVAYDTWGASSLPVFAGVNVQIAAASDNKVVGLLGLAVTLANPDLTTQVVCSGLVAWSS